MARELKIYLDAIFSTIAFQCYFELYYWAFGALLLYLLVQGVLNNAGRPLMMKLVVEALLPGSGYSAADTTAAA